MPHEMWGPSAGRRTGRKAAGPLGSGCPQETLGSHSVSEAEPQFSRGRGKSDLWCQCGQGGSWRSTWLGLSLRCQRCPVHAQDVQTGWPELLSRGGASAPSFLPGASPAWVQCAVMPPPCLATGGHLGSPAGRKVMGPLGGGLFRERASWGQGQRSVLAPTLLGAQGDRGDCGAIMSAPPWC